MRQNIRTRTSRWWIGLAAAAALLGPVAWLQPAGAAENPPPGSSKRLPRMYDGAPPQIPHSIAGLQGLCLGCHLEGAQGAAIVPHPDRPNCLQCHVSQDPSVKPLVRNSFGDPGPGRRK
ncbi:MAG: hypothetical protein AABZ16_05110 [candidate division NC10 bacterium]